MARKTKADLEKEILKLKNDIRDLLGRNGQTAKYTQEVAYNIIFSLEDALWSGEPLIEKDNKWGFEFNGVFKYIENGKR